MLESEAKTKWCPNVRFIQMDTGSLLDNRGTVTDSPYSSWRGCLGPTCACWRDDGYNDKAGEREGHCGLAR
jgi:hypothetical protein